MGNRAATQGFLIEDGSVIGAGSPAAKNSASIRSSEMYALKIAFRSSREQLPRKNFCRQSRLL
jgi:hypothetical protein